MGPMGNVGGRGPLGPPEDSREGLPETARWVGVFSPRGDSSLDVNRESEGFRASSLSYVCSAGRLAKPYPGTPNRHPSPGITPANWVTSAGLSLGCSAGVGVCDEFKPQRPQGQCCRHHPATPRPQGPGAPAPWMDPELSPLRSRPALAHPPVSPSVRLGTVVTTPWPLRGHPEPWPGSRAAQGCLKGPQGHSRMLRPRDRRKVGASLNGSMPGPLPQRAGGGREPWTPQRGGRGSRASQGHMLGPRTSGLDCRRLGRAPVKTATPCRRAGHTRKSVREQKSSPPHTPVTKARPPHWAGTGTASSPSQRRGASHSCRAGAGPSRSPRPPSPGDDRLMESSI